MKKKVILFVKRYRGIGLLCLFLFACFGAGCSQKQVLLHTAKETTQGAQEREILLTKEEETGEKILTEDTIPAFLEEEGQIAEEESVCETSAIWVHVSGEVNLPGVYELPEGSRIYEAIREAGGITDRGDGEYLNQAGLLEDGMKVTVPSREQVKEWESRGETGLLWQTKETDEKEGGSRTEDGRIDINTADESLLCTLPGIGSSRAKSIIAYREEAGGFSKIEDIMKVTGIKEGAFEKIKEYIKVGG